MTPNLWSHDRDPDSRGIVRRVEAVRASLGADDSRPYHHPKCKRGFSWSRWTKPSLADASGYKFVAVRKPSLGVGGQSGSYVCIGRIPDHAGGYNIYPLIILSRPREVKRRNLLLRGILRAMPRKFPKTHAELCSRSLGFLPVASQAGSPGYGRESPAAVGLLMPAAPRPAARSLQRRRRR